MRRFPRFVLRTIRDGRVRIFGRTFRVSEQHRPYNGELEGFRYAFGLYRRSYDPDQPLEPFVCLWGTEADFRWNGPEDQEPPEATGPHIVDGHLPWDWWNEERPAEAAAMPFGADL